MLTFKSARLDDEGRVLESVYEARHANPGRSTTLTLDVLVRRDTLFGHVKASAVLAPSVEAGTAEEALDKLADWAERLALAIRHRGEASNDVPVFSEPTKAPSSSSYAVKEDKE